MLLRWCNPYIRCLIIDIVMLYLVLLGTPFTTITTCAINDATIIELAVKYMPS